MHIRTGPVFSCCDTLACQQHLANLFLTNTKHMSYDNAVGRNKMSRTIWCTHNFENLQKLVTLEWDILLGI